MRIVVKSKEGPNIWLPVPSVLVFNRFTAWLVPRLLKEHGIDIKPEQAAAFVRLLNQYRRTHPEWVLVEVQSTDGEYVKIQL